MKIEITINAPGLEEAINNLAESISKARILETPTKQDVRPTAIKEEQEEVKTPKQEVIPESAPTVAPSSPIVEMDEKEDKKPSPNTDSTPKLTATNEEGIKYLIEPDVGTIHRVPKGHEWPTGYDGTWEETNIDEYRKQEEPTPEPTPSEEGPSLADLSTSLRDFITEGKKEGREAPESAALIKKAFSAFGVTKASELEAKDYKSFLEHLETSVLVGDI